MKHWISADSTIFRPHTLIAGRLRHFAALIAAAGVAAVFALLRPPAGTPTSWLLFSLLGLGLSTAFVPWERRAGLVQVILLLIFDLMLGAILWLNPEHPIVLLVMVLVSAWVGARYHPFVVLFHLLATTAAFSLHVLAGGDLASAVLVGLTVVVVSGFLTALSLSLQREWTRKRSLQTLLELLPVLKAHGVAEVVSAAVSQLVKATSSDSGILFLVDSDRNLLRVNHIHAATPLLPAEEEAWYDLEVPIGRGLVGWAAQHQMAVMTGNAAKDPRAHQLPGTPIVDESIIAVPLMTQGKVHGVIRLTRNGLDRYAASDLEMVELMAAHVADAVARAALEERLSRTDALTGVYNRHYLNEWSQGLSGEALISLLMVDCRQFKQINDRFGHLAGDRVLREAARLIKESIRSGDLVVRYGGDEFLVVLRRMSVDQARIVADRIQMKVGAWNAAQPENGPRLLIDVGIESATEADWTELLERADVQMYASKRSAR